MRGGRLGWGVGGSRGLLWRGGGLRLGGLCGGGFRPVLGECPAMWAYSLLFLFVLVWSSCLLFGFVRGYLRNCLLSLYTLSLPSLEYCFLYCWWLSSWSSEPKHTTDGHGDAENERLVTVWQRHHGDVGYEIWRIAGTLAYRVVLG